MKNPSRFWTNGPIPGLVSRITCKSPAPTTVHNSAVSRHNPVNSDFSRRVQNYLEVDNARACIRLPSDWENLVYGQGRI